jgi:hypothetical protein
MRRPSLVMGLRQMGLLDSSLRWDTRMGLGSMLRREMPCWWCIFGWIMMVSQAGPWIGYVLVASVVPAREGDG